ncbi:monofunctional glycosyltransferase domain protein [Staphylococcus aureus subsp. aureus IS-55]|nr:monofunctional glycosyltransferase [Staphylococcus aureus subsp. aureus TCH130]EFH25388.1 monofunctional glycosyltransferase [Staphylococcus aureus subsp. aureus ATCC 51811]EGG67901.1 monofunctional glycosyltransferase domain protein [Staphylococcus aureus subsp. aureus 21193]EGL86118.1 monofunctional glycosyltransferase domain protein [Staphylococcus aureus subsp. aureus 21305]EGL93169.1 monofunctional glycosyltransferase domain protein [Staphylococcus aureus subsp. aureus 21318]EGS84362.1
MKRSDRYSNSNEHFEHMKHEPHYNTYYQPVGKPPKKKKVNEYY